MISMMERYLLRYFLAVMDEGNFSRAAERCRVSQPTLSVGIAKLEEGLGHPLFLRSNRRVELTEAGARLAPLARRIEAQFAQAEREVSSAPLPHGTLRLGMLSTLPLAWSETVLVRLARGGANGERLELVDGRERDLLERLGRGRVDVALTIVRDGQGRFAAEPWFDEGYALALSATHPLAGRAEIAAEELASEPMIARRQCEILADTSRFFTAKGVRPFFPARTADEQRALAYVRAGLAITVMPDCYTDPDIVRPRLVGFPYARRIGLLYAAHVDPDEMRARPPLQHLAALVKEAVGQTDQ